MPFHADSEISLFIYGHTEIRLARTPLAHSDGILSDHGVAVFAV